MKLGLQVGYWFAGPTPGVAEQVAAAERLGFDSIWFAEAYGSDCFTPLAWYGQQTSGVQLGTAVCQLSARTPTATAMTALTLDHLTGGRMILGLGASGPQVVEGWYGERYPRPLARTREYVEIIRRVLAREEPLTFDGDFYQLPRTGPDTTGLGKPIKSITHPRRADLPIYLGAEGPKNVALAAEIADGWLPLFMGPGGDAYYRAALQEGFDRPGARRGWDDFEVCATVSVVVNDDVEVAVDSIRQHLGFYIGGMGARDVNFHADVFSRMGYEAEVHDIQDLFLSGAKAEAIASVPRQLVEDIALVGPVDKIRDDLARWEETCITTMLVSGPPLALEVIADTIRG
ncbi:MAG TPA: LLM class F420-dependent oxidoreductase [Acidimicrobiales bacterium]|nr:LLM class F420-dependent oxidoreductase [Acidimicrobiales bacterium]